MSGQPDLDLDAILADFYREERKEPPVEEARPVRPRAAAPIVNSGEKAAEGTILYESHMPRHAAPAPQPAPQPAEPEKPAPQPAEPEKPAPQPAREKQSPKPAPERQTAKPAAKPGKEPARRPSEPKHGRGFALMFLTLLLLAAVLAGLLRWTIRAEEAASPGEPEPLRLELGESLERSLDESAATTR